MTTGTNLAKTRNESDRLAYKKQCHFNNFIVKKAESDCFCLFLRVTRGIDQEPKNSGIL